MGTVSPQPQPRQDHSNMAPQKTPASNKNANADAKKKVAAKSETRKTPIKMMKATPKTTLKSKKMPALKTPTLKTKANPAVAVKNASPLKKNEMAKKASTLKTSKTPSKKISLKTLKSPAVKSKAVKKASPLKKVAEKVIKKKGEKMAIKKVDAKSSKGGVAAFDLEAFVKVKFSELEKTAHQKKNVSGRTNSTVADLSKFNLRTANEVYKVEKEESLEAILLALHLPADQEKMDLSPKVASVYKEVADYQDLLLLGDLPTITQEKRPYSWISTAPSLSSEAQTALTTSLMGLTLKLTGAKVPGNFKLKLPGGKMRSKSRTEVLAYLALIQNIVDAMAGSKNWKKAAKDSKLDKMHADITKIVAEF